MVWFFHIYFRLDMKRKRMNSVYLFVIINQKIYVCSRNDSCKAM